MRFCAGAWGTLRKLRSSELRYAPILANYMTVLNDQAIRVWEKHIGRDEREYRMYSLGIDCSIEQPKTIAKERLSRIRTYTHRGEDMVMSWHAKILGHTGRMYFLVDTELKYDADPYVYIGGFTNHFETS